MKVKRWALRAFHCTRYYYNIIIISGGHLPTFNFILLLFLILCRFVSVTFWSTLVGWLAAFKIHQFYPNPSLLFISQNKYDLRSYFIIRHYWIQKRKIFFSPFQILFTPQLKLFVIIFISMSLHTLPSFKC